MSKSRLKWLVKWVGGFALSVIVIVVIAIEVFNVGRFPVPPNEPVQEMIFLDQGWKDGREVGQAQWYHHASQGTKLLRYDWFIALEQPELSIFAAPDLFHKEDYLSRFGFLPSKQDDTQNPDGLPVGFAVTRGFQEPFAKQPYKKPAEGEPYPYASEPYDVVGLTCAACHTSQLNYRGKGVRIEGGPAMIDLDLFRDAFGRALFYTYIFPTRFDRFARKVLEDDYNGDTKQELRVEFDRFFVDVREEKEFEEEKQINNLKMGFGRNDALGRIVNRVFKDLDRENLTVTDAPVNYPHVWDAPWFDWVQYNASIRPPMVRNIGEALGVGAKINLDPNRGEMWKSTVNIENLYQMEHQLAGDEPFEGLRAPQWPEEVLGKIDADLQAKGAKLYRKRCIGCHSLMTAVKEAYEGSNEGRKNLYWTKPNQYGRRFIKTKHERVGGLSKIGTDPAQAVNFNRGVVHFTVDKGSQIIPASKALDYTTSRVREVKYAQLGLTKEERIKYDGYRLPWENFKEQLLRERAEPDDDGLDKRTNGDLEKDFSNFQDSNARLAYKARPLNGTWATAPYLHNGSVLNVYQLLSPVKERARTFYLGSKEFDPELLGFKSKARTGYFKMDTSLPGNRNTGHEFRDLKEGEEKPVKGVIGPKLSHNERMAIIEYLKSL